MYSYLFYAVLSNGSEISVHSFNNKILQFYKAKNIGIALAITRLFNIVD